MKYEIDEQYVTAAQYVEDALPLCAPKEEMTQDGKGAEMQPKEELTKDEEGTSVKLEAEQDVKMDAAGEMESTRPLGDQQVAQADPPVPSRAPELDDVKMETVQQDESGDSEESDDDLEGEVRMGVGQRLVPFLTPYDRLDLIVRALHLVEIHLSQEVVSGRYMLETGKYVPCLERPVGIYAGRSQIAVVPRRAPASGEDQQDIDAKPTMSARVAEHQGGEATAAEAKAQLRTAIGW